MAIAGNRAHVARGEAGGLNVCAGDLLWGGGAEATRPIRSSECDADHFPVK